MARRKYSDHDRAAALAALDANGGNVFKTSKQLSIPRATLQEWAAGRVNDDVPELRHEKKQELSERLDEIAHKILDVLPKKLAEATAPQLATALGIVIDKKQLLTGEATSRNEVKVDLDGTKERLARLVNRHASDGTTPDDSEQPDG